MSQRFAYPQRMAETRTPTPKGTHGVLSMNLKAYMRAPDLDSQTKMQKATKVPARTIGRILNGEQSASVAMLEKLAEGLKCQPWHLLMPGLDPQNVPLPNATLTPFQLQAIARILNELSALADKQSSLATGTQQGLQSLPHAAQNVPSYKNEKPEEPNAKESHPHPKAGRRRR
jgi:transcriptional regulator with XRE-family HTH domain